MIMYNYNMYVDCNDCTYYRGHGLAIADYINYNDYNKYANCNSYNGVLAYSL